MPNFKLFFLRFDVIRSAARILFPIMAVSSFWVFLGYLWWYIPLTVLMGIAALWRAKIPGVIEAAELLKKEHNERADQLLRGRGGMTEATVWRLEGFLPEKVWLARSTGSRIIAPVCLTAVLLCTGNAVELRAIRFRLGERGSSEELAMDLSASVRHTVGTEPLKKGKLSRVRIETEGSVALEFLCQRDYHLEEFLNAIPEYR